MRNGLGLRAGEKTEPGKLLIDKDKIWLRIELGVRLILGK
jgi:hypothetical protein